jgi:hypothetical protein
MGADGPVPDWEQAADRRDRAGDQRDLHAAARDDLAEERDRAARRRDQRGGDREQAAQEREWAARRREREATARDEAAEHRDLVAGQRMWPRDAGRWEELYEQAAVDRELDASDRRAAAADRTVAAQDRVAAVEDQRAGAADRAAAAEDRDSARWDRSAAAQDRFRAAADRKQAAVERAQRVRDHPADPMLERSHQRVEDLHGVAQETYRTVAGLVAQFVEAKQGELAAHGATVQAYEQLAVLQEQLGHADRAAEARAKGQRAREADRVAAAELAVYLARIEAVQDARAHRRSDRTGRAGG